MKKSALFLSAISFIAFLACETPSESEYNNPYDLTGLTADQAAVNLDALGLQIGYASGDSASSVTQKLTLPGSGSEGSSITWSSSISSYVGADGSVTRPVWYFFENRTVTLTATLKKNDVSSEKTFQVTVICAPETDQGDVEADLDYLTGFFNSHIIISKIWLSSGDHLLLTKGGFGSTITYTSSATNTSSSCYFVSTGSPQEQIYTNIGRKSVTGTFTAWTARNTVSSYPAVTITATAAKNQAAATKQYIVYISLPYE